MQTNNISKRITPLDGVRGIAILMVIVGHLFIDPFNKKIQSFNPTLYNITSNYSWGVLLFFVISGFLIGGILIRNKPSISFIKSFYIRRIIRIWPLYFFLIIFVVGGLYMVSNLPTKITPFWTYLVFLQNFWKHTQYYHLIEAGVTWSLAIEEQFYLLAPLLLINASFNKIRNLVIISLVISFILRVIANLHVGIMLPIHHHLFNISYENPGFLIYVDVILIGVMGAAIIKSKSFLNFMQKKHISLFIFPIIGTLFYLASVKYTNIVMLSCLPDIVGLLFLSVIMIIVTNQTFFISKLLCNNLLVKIGQGCYFIYLFHIVVMVNIQQTFIDLEWNHLFLANLLSGLLTIGAALISWKLIEYPMMSYGRKKYPYNAQGMKNPVLCNEVSFLQENRF